MNEIFEKYEVDMDDIEFVRELEDQMNYNSLIKQTLGKISYKLENDPKGSSSNETKHNSSSNHAIHNLPMFTSSNLLYNVLNSKGHLTKICFLHFWPNFKMP